MSVSVSASQARILVAAIVLVTISQSDVLSIGDGRAASRAATAEPPAGARVPATEQSDQPPARLRNSAQAVRRVHHLARRYDRTAREPPAAETAEARQPLLPSVMSVQAGETENPRSSDAVMGPAAPALRSGVEAVSGRSFERRDPGDALAIIATLADTYDDTRMSPMWAGSPPSRAPLAPARLITLIAACSCAAIGLCGAVAYKSRRRAGRA
ncbi:MAG TPA: hypothetical protein VG291_05340 [Xanthobacteraceae bacterium]|nr:hypothetical protein [Xanthobacteraceae bacterium]